MTQSQMSNGQPPLVAAVVSSSPLMRSRLASPLEKMGFRITPLAGVDALVKTPRQRPFAVCFFDARGPDGRHGAVRCFKVRPGERFVLIREDWDRCDKAAQVCAAVEFGQIAEGFTPQEVIGWASRAATEERLTQGEQPLEELLYDRFRNFLYNLGPAPMNNLHELISERVERPLIQAVLEWSGGNQSRAAELLGLHRNTLRTKLRALGVTSPRRGGKRAR